MKGGGRPAAGLGRAGCCAGPARCRRCRGAARCFDVVLALGLARRDPRRRRRRRRPAGRRRVDATGAFPVPAGVRRSPVPFLPIEPRGRAGRAGAAARAGRAAAGVPPPVSAGGAVGRAAHGAAGERPRRRAGLSFYACVIAAYTAAVVQPVPGAGAGQPAGGGAAVQPQVREPAVPDRSRTSAVPFLILVPIAVAADGLRRGNAAPTRAGPSCPRWNASRPRRCAARSSTNAPGSPASCTTW